MPHELLDRANLDICSVDLDGAFCKATRESIIVSE